MNIDISVDAETRRVVSRTGRWLIGVFWLAQFAELSVVSFVEEPATAWRSLGPRAIVLVIGVALTMALVSVAARGVGQALRARLIKTIGTALAMWLLLAAINFTVFYFALGKAERPIHFSDYIYTAFAWSWFFLSLATALVAISNNIEARQAERRLAEMESVANNARLATLRYQLNPHFLFNTLNSVIALIDARENERAEVMAETLSTFLRTTLELDPLVDIALDREMELQAQYLSIEQVRYPVRLRTAFVIPEDLGGAMVPPLITQPLIENAIRHAVGRSRTPVTISVTATAHRNQLRITIEDDGPSILTPASPGTGVGIANVRARLEGRFGTEQSLTARKTDTGYVVVIEMPLVLGTPH